MITTQNDVANAIDRFEVALREMVGSHANGRGGGIPPRAVCMLLEKLRRESGVDINELHKETWKKLIPYCCTYPILNDDGKPVPGLYYVEFTDLPAFVNV